MDYAFKCCKCGDPYLASKGHLITISHECFDESYIILLENGDDGHI